jgi:hypothetical protein
MYILEAQLYTPMRGFEHVGYFNKIFRTKRAAAEYYNAANPHMRHLNAHNTWASDWDPNTQIRYVVRKFDREYCGLDELV